MTRGGAYRVSKKRLTAEQFDAVIKTLKMKKVRVDAARSAMVDGKNQSDVAADFKYSRQSIMNTINCVWNRWLDFQSIESQLYSSQNLPDGWSRIVVVAPNEYISRFQDGLIAYLDERKSKDSAG